jgi:hypothetical protein
LNGWWALTALVVIKYGIKRWTVSSGHKFAIILLNWMRKFNLPIKKIFITQRIKISNATIRIAKQCVGKLI